MIALRIRAVAALAAAAVMLLFPGVGDAKHRHAPMARKDFYSVHLNLLLKGENDVDWAKINRALEDIAHTGFHGVRIIASWKAIEPERPLLNDHTYEWGDLDRLIGMAAEHGLRAQPMYGYTPDWATSEVSCLFLTGIYSPAPSRIDDWQLALRAFTKRYGPEGGFWSRNPDVPYRPIKIYEIWNEPNLWSYWCPQSDPEEYAHYLYESAKEIHGVQPNAKVMFAGMPKGAGRSPGLSLTADEFLRRAFTAEPRLLNVVDAIGIHPYSFNDRKAMMFRNVASFREALRAAGIPDSIPMYITEIGWPRNGTPSFTEVERSARFRLALRGLMRTNCNVAGITAYAWATEETDTSSPHYWDGLANRQTMEPYPVVDEIRRSIAVMLGHRSAPPPRTAVMRCAGMPKPDQDGDGIPDERDRRPLRPDRR